MERIASFTVDHDVLVPGLYLSRQDGDVVTRDHTAAEQPGKGRGGVLRPHGVPDGILFPV